MTLSIVTYCVILRNDKLQKDTTQVNYVSLGTDVAFPVRCQKYVFVCEETSTLLRFCECHLVSTKQNEQEYSI